MTIKHITRDEVTRETEFDENTVLRKGIDANVRSKAEQDENGTPILTFIMSTPDVDRDNDTIDVNGWQTDNFLKSGNMIWAHDGSLPPIGKPLSVSVESNALMCRMLMTPKDFDHPLGQLVTQMYQADFLRGVSVGFRPTRMAFNDERGSGFGMDFFEQELIELSATPVPANPNAVHVMRSMGVNTQPLLDWTKRALDQTWGKSGSVWVPAVSLTGNDGETRVREGREIVEDLHKALGGEKTTVQVPEMLKELGDKVDALATRVDELVAENEQLKSANQEPEPPTPIDEPEPAAPAPEVDDQDKMLSDWLAEKSAEPKEPTADEGMIARAVKDAVSEWRMETTGRLPGPS